MSRKRVVYYAEADGESPVLRDINQCSFQELQKIRAYISLLEDHGEGLRRPVSDYVGDKLYELRPYTQRVLYFFILRDYVVIVHIFRKKTQKLPDNEKNLALRRRQDFIDRYAKGHIKLEEGVL